MKIKQLLVLLALIAMNLCAMEPEHKQSAIELLPEETKVYIFEYLDDAPSIEQAVQNIQNAARMNQDFSRLLNDQPLTKKFIDRLVAKFPEETQKDRILAAIYLNTAGSRIWLDKNHPEWKEYAKNLAKKILGGFFNTAPTGDASVILNALLNVPGIADYIKNYKDDRSRTALIMAAFGGHPTLVEKLLAVGADSNIISSFSLTALDYAHGHVAIIKLLESHMKKAIS